MITIHEPNALSFSDNGLGVLDPISCILSVTINGAWSLELEHPFDEEEKYKNVQKNNIIKIDGVSVVREQTSTYQLYRIYDTVRTLSTVKAIAFPVAFEATYDAIIEELKIEKKTATLALQDIMTYLSQHGVTKYTVSSDWTGATARQRKGSWSNTNLIAAISGSDEGSIINHWGGEVAYDNYKIIVNGKLGSDAGYEFRYGKNIAGLSVDTDISGVVTRLYPVSEDGVRLKRAVNNTEVSYYEPPEPNHTGDYPYIRAAFIKAPYNLIDTSYEVNKPNTDTAVLTHTAQTQLTSGVQAVATQIWSTLTEGLPLNYDSIFYEPEWVQSIIDDAIVQCQKDLTTNIAHPTWKNLIQTCIKDGLSWIKNQEIVDFYWAGNYAEGYTYTNGTRTIKGQYYYVDKRFCWFNGAGNYEPWKDVAAMDWIQSKSSNTRKKYGDNKRYFAKDTYINTWGKSSESASGNDQVNEYWFDSDGWWDGTDYTQASWDWHGSGTQADPYWYGESGASASDTGKFAHDCWMYIYRGTRGLFYFDEKGYLVDELTYDPGWSWQKSKGNYYFGSDNKAQNAVYIHDQWLKVDGTWQKFDDSSVLSDMKVVKTQFINALKAILSTAISSTITTYQNQLYDLLYTEMNQYCGQQFEEGIDLPVVNITANLLDLINTPEYADIVDDDTTQISSLKKMKLGDGVKIIDYTHQVYDKEDNTFKDVIDERVVGLKYDVLRGYNTEISISDPYRGFDRISQAANYNGSYDELSPDLNGKELIAGEGVNITNGIISMEAPVGDRFDGTQVSVEQILTSGIKLGTVYLDGTPYDLYCTEEGGLKYWVETSTDIYRTGSHPETEISDRYYYDTVRYWQSRSATHMYYGQYNFKRANDYPAIIGNYGTGMVNFVLASEVEHGADWLWADAADPQDTYHSPSAGDGRYVWSGTVTYHGKTYYASIGQYNFEQGDTITTPFVSFNTDYSKPYASIVADLLDTAISTVSVNDITGISNQNTVFYFGNGSYANHENVCWITKDGVFHGKGFEVDGEPISGLSKTELYSGSQYTSPINLSESYNGFSFILIETYNSNDKKNLSTLLSVSDLTSGSYVGIDNYLLYTITNTKKLTFHDDFDDTNHSRYIKKIYGLRSGDSEHGGSDNAVLDVNVDGNSVVANRIANIDLTGKQDNLIAGNNITIGSDGKTINATDTDEISELADVSITNLANGQILKWNSTTSKWENVSGGGGGGSTVDIDPTLSSGTKIADYEIDGVAGELYAPTPVTYSAGSNVQINNGVISATDTTYNDYDGSAHGLVAPPSTTGSGRYLKEDGTWDTPSGGGGTTVIANPSGTATADLEKLQVGNDIYSIPSGGGASGDSIDLSKVSDWDYFELTYSDSRTIDYGNIYMDRADINKASFNCSGRKLIVQGVQVTGYTENDEFYTQLVSSVEFVHEDSTNLLRVYFNIHSGYINRTFVRYVAKFKCYSPKQGTSSDEITLYRNGSWATQSYITFAEYLCTETASGIECQGMHAGVVVSNVSNLNNAYSIIMKIESQNGFDYQTGRCYPNSDLDGVISYGTDRITYNNDSVGAGEIEVEIQTSANTEGVFFGGGYGVSTTDYVIKEIKLVPVQKRKYS